MTNVAPLPSGSWCVPSAWRPSAPLRRGGEYKTISDRMPVQSDIDSNNPPTRPPNRFAPSAPARKPSFAKLRTKTMPAKKTGRQRTSVATNIFDTMEGKRNFSSGTQYDTPMATKIPT